MMGGGFQIVQRFALSAGKRETPLNSPFEKRKFAAA